MERQATNVEIKAWGRILYFQICQVYQYLGWWFPINFHFLLIQRRWHMSRKATAKLSHETRISNMTKTAGSWILPTSAPPGGWHGGDRKDPDLNGKRGGTEVRDGVSRLAWTLEAWKAWGIESADLWHLVGRGIAYQLCQQKGGVASTSS